ncbi:MAG: superoxide dismutase [Pseudomonadota bacterium]
MDASINEAPQTTNNLSSQTSSKKHLLPPLKYDYAALEPYIDSRTMILHHDNHHATYVKKLNEALMPFPELQEYSALWLLCHLNQLPASIQAAVQHNAGGHVNHSLFWRAIKPFNAGEPRGTLREAINRDFGSLAEFKKRFEEEGAKVFGSGWVWLVKGFEQDSQLQIMTTTGHDHPLMQNLIPILLNDVWEHAYYLQYESRRPDYLKAWWSVVDWEQATSCYESNVSSVEEILIDENKQFLAVK